jgi:hypothetical protein
VPTPSIFVTRDEVERQGLLNVAPYSVAADIMKALHRGNLDNVHIPHSDVYFVRAAIEKNTGYYLPLDVVEQLMRERGWRDRKGTLRYGD